MIRIAIEHRTVYRYDRPIRLGPHVIRLRPAPHCRTPILAYSLGVRPDGHFINWQQDPSGNHLARLVFPEPTGSLEITVDLVADMTVINPFDFFIDEAARRWPFEYDDGLAQDLAPYLAPVAAGPPVERWVAGIPRTPTPLIDFLVALNRRVRDDVDYSVRMEHGVQTPDETLELGVGSCRDSSWLLVAILRRLGIAARFASGYLVQLAADKPGPTGPSTDSTDLHAWAEAYVPGAGWVGLDPTSGLLAGEGHIPLACTSTPAAAAPIEGRREAAETSFEFSNLVTRFAELPRVTLPYTDEQWQRIDALGEAVDVALEAGDTRLTMGGEPTFVAIGAGQAAEWNIAADGPTKRPMATALGIRLAGRLAPGALIQHSQGKWYPGEPLPRWQVGVNWRVDGHPLWRDPALLADPTSEGETTAAQTRAFADQIAAGLGLPADICVPAYEDPVGRLWTEARLPAGDPLSAVATEPPDGALASGVARAAIIGELDAERGEPKGVAIPLHRAAGDDEWTTGRWTIRRGALFLIAGDSPIGLRL
ncbi:MAG TPA: transglutaminase family protein, partial [Solirubrobacteraceae bacterium]|nr:transglutaminase family protein [Solirubrobacteraceae bacterium]